MEKVKNDEEHRKDANMRRVVARFNAVERRHVGTRGMVISIANRIVSSARRNGISVTDRCAELLALDLAPVILKLPYEFRLSHDENVDKALITLTLRERQIIIGLALGLSSGEMAASLGVTETTIKSRRAAAYKAMGVCTAGQAVAVAIKYGLISALDISDV